MSGPGGERQPLLQSPSARNIHIHNSPTSSTATLDPALGGTDSPSYNGDVVVEVENQALGRLFSSLLVDSIPGEYQYLILRLESLRSQSFQSDIVICTTKFYSNGLGTCHRPARARRAFSSCFFHDASDGHRRVVASLSSH